MDLQQLMYFREVARLENITKAANELHISQPSLSVSIAKLEEELGAKLFDRVSGRIRLNDIGQRFYRHTDRIFLSIQNARQEVADFSGQCSKVVHFAVTASSLCSELLHDFMADHRDYEMHHFLHNEMNALSLLEEGKVDFVIAVAPLQSPLIEWKLLKKERLYLLMSADNPLAGERLISMELLRECNYVVVQSAFHPDGEFAEFFRQAGFQPKVQCTTNELEAMVAMVELNVGVAIASEQTAHKLVSDVGRRLAAAPIDSDYEGRTVGVARLKGHYFTHAVQQFYDFTVDFFSGLN